MSSGLVEIPGGSFDPDVLRVACEAHCRNPFNPMVETKAVVVLYLLDVWEAACDAATRTTSVSDAQSRLLEAINGAE